MDGAGGRERGARLAADFSRRGLDLRGRVERGLEAGLVDFGGGFAVIFGSEEAGLAGAGLVAELIDLAGGFDLVVAGLSEVVALLAGSLTATGLLFLGRQSSVFSIFKLQACSFSLALSLPATYLRYHGSSTILNIPFNLLRRRHHLITFHQPSSL